MSPDGPRQQRRKTIPPDRILRAWKVAEGRTIGDGNCTIHSATGKGTIPPPQGVLHAHAAASDIRKAVIAHGKAASAAFKAETGTNTWTDNHEWATHSTSASYSHQQDSTGQVVRCLCTRAATFIGRIGP